jgi:hypothetical protein
LESAGVVGDRATRVVAISVGSLTERRVSRQSAHPGLGTDAESHRSHAPVAQFLENRPRIAARLRTGR